LFASAGADQIVTLWRKHELYKLHYRPLRWLKGHTDTVFSVTLSNDERYLASGSADATIRVWDLELMWSEPRILKGHRGAVYAVVACPTYPLLASAGQDGTLRLWDLPTGQLLKSVQAHSQAIRFLAFSPDGSLLVSSGNDNVTRLWSIVDQEIVGEPRNLQVERQATLTGCGPAAFNQAGNILATSDRSGKLTLWRTTQA
jgi:WD40 repeat protein